MNGRASSKKNKKLINILNQLESSSKLLNDPESLIKRINERLQAGVDPNVPNEKNGKTLLHYAAENNCLRVIEFLLQKKADLNVKDKSGKTPSEYATKDECRQVIENKRNSTTPDSSVGERNDYSNSSGDDSQAKSTELSDCNAKKDQGHGSDDFRENEESSAKSPNNDNLTFTDQQTSSELLEVNNSSEKLLLEKGADLNAQDQSGETLFEYATEDATEDEYKGSSHSSDDSHENEENAADERHVSGDNDQTDKGNLTNDFSNDPNKHDEDSSCNSSDYLFLEDSLLAKLEIPLTTDEQKLTDKFCKEISGINKKEPKENILESIEKIVNEYLNKGIRLNSNYNDKDDKKTVTNLIFEEIKDVLDDPLKPRNGTKKYINDKASDIISNSLLAGGKAKEFFRNNLTQRYSSNDFNDLDKKYKEIKSKLKSIAYESIVKKSTQTQDGLEVGRDNGYFCIEYPQDSIIEPAKILNNKKAKELNLKAGILKIGESIVRVERVNGKRNYTDILKGSIEMSFTTEVGEISICLHPSEKDSNKIEVEIGDESKAKLNKLKAEKKSLGENCLLGGKSVLKATEDKGFEKNGSVSTETTKDDLSTNLTQVRLQQNREVALGG